MVKVVELLPDALLAVIVYVVAGLAAVGVPLMVPVTMLKLNPCGKAGLIE